MTNLIYAAVALGDQIERYGSYFGYAAVVGLGVLSLLYFAQAREVKRLREWAGRSPERDAELSNRVQADAQRRVVAEPVSAPPPAAQTPSPQTVAAQQADAARKAAAATVAKFQQPATGAAPVAGPPGQLARPASGVTPGAAAPPAGAPAATGSAGTVGTPPAPGSVPGAAAGPPALPPAAPAAGPAGVRPSSTPNPAAAAAAAARAAPARSPAFTNGAGGQDTHESAAARPSPLPDLPPRPPRATSTSALDEDDGGLSGGRIGLIVGGVAAVLAVAVVLVLVLSSGGDKPPAEDVARDPAPPAAVAPPSSKAPAKVDRAATPVAVLNGTTQTGLARAFATKLEDSGFSILSFGTNSDQQIAKTTVSYADGSEQAARDVAKIVGASTAAVQPIDTNTAAAVAPEAKVVVVVGGDRSSAG